MKEFNFQIAGAIIVFILIVSLYYERFGYCLQDEPQKIVSGKIEKVFSEDEYVGNENGFDIVPEYSMLVDGKKYKLHNTVDAALVDINSLRRFYWYCPPKKLIDSVESVYLYKLGDKYWPASEKLSQVRYEAIRDYCSRNDTLLTWMLLVLSCIVSAFVTFIFWGNKSK